MIHAFASIWWCLMHDIKKKVDNRDQRKSMCARTLENKHTIVEMETIVSLYTENI